MPNLFSEPMLVSGPHECRFYHTIDLPVSGFQKGQWDLRGRFDDYTANVPLAGKTVLDVGTASGFLTFEAEKRGATVVGVEAASTACWERLPFAQRLPFIDRPAWDTAVADHLDGVKRSYWLAHRELGSRARVHYGDTYDLPDALGLFDVVIVGQILVHLRDVIRAVTSISRRCGDTLIIAEAMLFRDETTSVFLGRANEPERDHSFWWHSVGLYRELLAMLGFRLDARQTQDYICTVERHPVTMPITSLVFRRVGSGMMSPPVSATKPAVHPRSQWTSGITDTWRKLKRRGQPDRQRDTLASVPPSESDRITPEAIDRLITLASAADRTDEGLDLLVGKLDHLVHALRMSGRLSRLSHEQIVKILYALRASGHERVQPLEVPTYNADYLAVWHKDPSFLQDERFMRAYQAGMNSGHHIVQPQGSAEDIHIEWRVAVCCWAAQHATHLTGAFVECGTNTGIYSLALCHYLDFNALGRSFYLFDTFRGIPIEQISPEEQDLGRTNENQLWYSECYEIARRNFAPFPGVQLIRGRVPESLASVAIDQVCYLSLDMNIAVPERAALEHFWPKLVSGAPVILDDYGWSSHLPQRRTADDFAASRQVEILTLPTGQGLLLKP